MCTNCCNSEKLAIKFAVDKSPVGKSLGLTGPEGTKKLNTFFTSEKI
jgi:hypothetical protein